MMIPTDDAGSGFGGRHRTGPIGIRPIFPAALQAILLEHLRRSVDPERRKCNGRTLGWTEGRAQHQLVGFRTESRLPPCVSIVNNALLARGLSDNTARDEDWHASCFPQQLAPSERGRAKSCLCVDWLSRNSSWKPGLSDALISALRASQSKKTSSKVRNRAACCGKMP